MLQPEKSIQKYTVKKRDERSRLVFVRRVARSPVFVVFSCLVGQTTRRKNPFRRGLVVGRRWFASSRRRLFFSERSRLKRTRRGETVGVFAGGEGVGRSKRRRAKRFLRVATAVVLRRTSTKRFNGLAELPYEQVEKEGAKRRVASRGNA